LVEVKVHVSSAIRRSAQIEMAAALEDPIQDRRGKVRVVEDSARLQAASGLFVVKIIGRSCR
jgi:hypothetical protein